MRGCNAKTCANLAACSRPRNLPHLSTRITSLREIGSLCYHKPFPITRFGTARFPVSSNAKPRCPFERAQNRATAAGLPMKLKGCRLDICSDCDLYSDGQYRYGELRISGSLALAYVDVALSFSVRDPAVFTSSIFA